MRTNIILPCLLVLLPLLWACTSDHFSIEGDIKNLGTQNVHFTWVGDDGVKAEVVAAQDGHFSLEGQCGRLTVVSVDDAQGNLLTRVVVNNGDHITIEGDATQRAQITAKGNDTNEQWSAFRREHAALYEPTPGKRLDQAIEQWVTAHPSEVLSTLLLLYDHQALLDDGKGMSLLAAISPEARPAHLITSVEALSNYYMCNAADRLFSLTLCGIGGDFETLNLAGRPSVIYFWSKSDTNHQRDIQAMKDFAERKGGGWLMADVLMDGDTVGWSSVCRTDNTRWHHLWSPGGPMDTALKGLRIASAPWFIVTDSVGVITYRGATLVVK